VLTVPDTQLDADGRVRKVWLFEFKIHHDQQVLPLASEAVISSQVLIESRFRGGNNADDDEIIDQSDHQQAENFERIEHVRGKLLAMEPKSFEFFIKDLLLHCGYSDVCVTKFSADGGVDVNARAGVRMWIFEDTLIQVQAKRWLHSVGRKEVAELLLAHGAAINAKNDHGDTPLHLAAMMGYEDEAKLLLDNNADVNARDDKGITPVGYAEQDSHKDLARMLRPHGGHE